MPTPPENIPIIGYFRKIAFLKDFRPCNLAGFLKPPFSGRHKLYWKKRGAQNAFKGLYQRLSFILPGRPPVFQYDRPAKCTQIASYFSDVKMRKIVELMPHFNELPPLIRENEVNGARIMEIWEVLQKEKITGSRSPAAISRAGCR